MSNDETKNTSKFNTLVVNEDLQRKISYLKENPEAKIVRLSDPQKGSTSQQLFGLISSIDTIKPVLNEVLNFKIDLKEPNKFYQLYGNYGKEYKEIVDKLKNLEKLGLELLKEIGDENAIKNKKLRERVFQKEEKKKDTPEINNEKKETSKASENAKSSKSVATKSVATKQTKDERK